MESQAFVERLLSVGIPLDVARKGIQAGFGDVASLPVRDPFADVVKKVGFLFTSRSGTTFFVDVLSRTKPFSRILEHMNPYRLKVGRDKWGARSNLEYLTECASRFTSPRGVFGFKGTVEALLPLVQADEIPRRVHEWRWITVRRDDVVSQAVSLYRAKLTGYWHDRGTAEAPAVPKYDFDGISRQIMLLQRRQGQIERFFATFGLEPLRLVYEDFADDPIPALELVYRHIGLPVPKRLGELVADSSYNVMRNAETEAMVERYHADLDAELRPSLLSCPDRRALSWE